MLEPLIRLLSCNTTTCLKQCLDSIVLILYSPAIASNICFYFRTFVNIRYYYGVKDIQQLKDSSIGVKSGEYGGRYAIIQPELCQIGNCNTYTHQLTSIMYEINKKVIVMDSIVVENQN